MLPLVNKRWARLLHEPSQAWRVVCIGHTYYETADDCVDDEDDVERWEEDAEKPQDAAAVLAWFTTRPG